MDSEFRKLVEMLASGAPIKMKDRGRATVYLSDKVWQECKKRFPGETSALVERALAKALLDDDDSAHGTRKKRS
jgi:hypothetical protein